MVFPRATNPCQGFNRNLETKECYHHWLLPFYKNDLHPAPLCESDFHSYLSVEFRRCHINQGYLLNETMEAEGQGEM